MTADPADAAGAPVPLVDAHCHLNHERFGAEAVAVAEAARAAGVVHLCIPGWNVASSERAVALARELGWADAAVGVHPHDAAKVGEADWRRLEGLAAEPVVAAVGETGLDFDRLFSPVEAQLENLERHLDLAARTGKPIVLHCRSKPGRRDAQDVLLEQLARWRAHSGAGALRAPIVLHSFSGPLNYARAALRLGAVLSFSGLVFRAGEEASAEAARLAPVEAILVETDAPFLAPPGVPGRRNEPAWVRATAGWLAAERGSDLGVLGPRLVATYETVFGPRPGGRGSGP